MAYESEPTLNPQLAAAIVFLLVDEPSRRGVPVEDACAVVSLALVDIAKALIERGAGSPIDVLDRIHAGACVRLAQATYTAAAEAAKSREETP